MLFGITYWNILAFIIMLALGESLYAPKLYEFLFLFAKKGREGSFLAITSAPMYLTMGTSGVLSGVLLKHFFPEEGPRQPIYIWATMIACCTLSFILQISLRNCFKRDRQDE